MGFFFLLFLIFIIELFLIRYVLLVLIKGFIYCVYELLESGVKIRNFYLEKNYEKWLFMFKDLFIMFFLLICYCKI